MENTQPPTKPWAKTSAIKTPWAYQTDNKEQTQTMWLLRHTSWMWIRRELHLERSPRLLTTINSRTSFQIKLVRAIANIINWVSQEKRSRRMRCRYRRLVGPARSFDKVVGWEKYSSLGARACIRTRIQNKMKVLHRRKSRYWIPSVCSITKLLNYKDKLRQPQSTNRTRITLRRTPTKPQQVNHLLQPIHLESKTSRFMYSTKTANQTKYSNVISKCS